MKINLTPAYTARVTKCRAAILAQQQTISDLRASLPKVQEQAKNAARIADEARRVADPRDDKSVKAVAEANTRADLWQAEIGKAEKQIADAVEALKPLCENAWLCMVDVVNEIIPIVRSEVEAFHYRHFEIERTAEVRASEADSLKQLEAMKAFDWHKRGNIETEGAGHCIHMLEELLGNHEGVRRFLFDGKAEFSMASGE